MHLRKLITAFPIICIACVTGTVVNLSSAFGFESALPAASSAIQTCITNFHTANVSEGVTMPATEFRYIVKLDARRKVVATPPLEFSAGQLPKCVQLKNERQKANVEVYRRIVQLINNQQEGITFDKNLVDTIGAIEKNSKFGWNSVGNSVVASPNMNYAVLKTSHFPLLLVNTSTLVTHVLTASLPSLDTPLAWSPDSNLLAYAIPETDQFQIYSIEQRAIITTRSNTGPWVKEMSWSPDKQQIATFGMHNRKLNKSPFGLLLAAAGHPNFSNDGILNVYGLDSDKHFSVLLRKNMRESDTAHIEISWE